jgi:hypothetical protein
LAQGGSGMYRLEDENLIVDFDPAKASVCVTDKRIAKKWEQIKYERSSHFELLAHTPVLLNFSLTDGIVYNITIELTGSSELLYTISADETAYMERMAYPAAFAAPDNKHYILQTDSQGLLLPVTDSFYLLEEQPLFYCGGGPGMAWIGVTDAELRSGYMAIFETPYDAAVLMDRNDGLITFAPVWYGSMERFSYHRKIRYIFFDKGGYVAQCKRYRSYIWPLNKVVSLAEKEKQVPALGKMLGSVHMYVWDTARDVGFINDLKLEGVDNALILWDANHRPYPSADYEEKARSMGYGTGGYELFSDTHPERDHIIPRDDLYLLRTSYPGMAEKIASRKKDGTFYSNIFGTYVCPEAVRPEMLKRTAREMDVYRHETYFIDVYQANGLYECHSEDHRLTRSQYADAIMQNYRLLAGRYGVYLGAEFGSDFANAHIAYAHGMMTLQRTWFKSEIGDKATIYYNGDWENNERPSIMLDTRTAPGAYHKYSINEYTRVPLYELVYHDAVVTSWRWEDCNHHTPELWWKKDLFNILYGTAPLWSLDMTVWKRYLNSFKKSYQAVTPWLSQICRDELTDHRFLTEDRKVQRSEFSSGRRVTVNFGDTEYCGGGKVIGGRSFLCE